MTSRTVGFASMLVVTMAMSTFALFALAVVASDLEAEFGLSKLQLGLLGAVNTGVGGLFAPLSGRLTDSLGGRRAMAAVLSISAVTLGLAALAPTYPLLLGALGLAGIAQGWGNPATNRAISTGIPLRQRGLVTGVKQSGVQLAVFLSGVGMPAIAAAWGWRAGLWVAAGASLLAMAGLHLITDMDSASPTGSPSSQEGSKIALSPFVLQVAVFGFLLGVVGGGLGRFLPLYAEEAVGFSVGRAGLVFALSGLIAIPTRIASGMFLDRGLSPRRILVAMGVGGALSFILIVSAVDGREGLLWAGTAVSGMTLGSWNTAANLAMVRERAGAGKATGMLMFGFLIGLTIGAPIVGWSIDTFDSYQPAWVACAGLCALGAAAVVKRRPVDAVAVSSTG